MIKEKLVNVLRLGLNITPEIAAGKADPSQYIKAAQEVLDAVEKEDALLSPSYYKGEGGLELYDFHRAFFGEDGLLSHQTMACIEYLARWKMKNGADDLKKVHLITGKMIQMIEQGETPKNEGVYS